MYMCTCLWFRTKTELATTIGGYTERMLQDHEQLDQLSIQADMWRSKFMATRCDIPTTTCLCACSAGYCYFFYTTYPHRVQNTVLHGVLNSLSVFVWMYVCACVSTVYSSTNYPGNVMTSATAGSCPRLRWSSCYRNDSSCTRTWCKLTGGRRQWRGSLAPAGLELSSAKVHIVCNFLLVFFPVNWHLTVYS